MEDPNNMRTAWSHFPWTNHIIPTFPKNETNFYFPSINTELPILKIKQINTLGSDAHILFANPIAELICPSLIKSSNCIAPN